MSDPETARRIDTLEERIAYQDDAIETLNQTITRQWDQIDAMARQIALLADRLREAEARTAASSPNDVPPPHY